MGFLFSAPKMPALPPVAPAPTPPSAELSAEEKKRWLTNKLQWKEKEEVENLLF
jgi:hypothetical protein